MVLGFGRKVKVQMEDGSHKVAPMVEGSGVFVCNIHEFVTDNLEDFNIHLKTKEGHTLTKGSTGRCVICHAKGVDMEGYPAGEEPVCDKCEHRLKRSREKVHERIAEASKKEKVSKA